MKKIIFYLAGLFVITFSFFALWALSSVKKHDFEGKCSMCHVNIPSQDTNRREMAFVREIDRLCAQCHTFDERMSHPTHVRPQKDIPLAAHLDNNGFLTCTTCHDVHKEDKVSDKSELSGLLWGHVKGRAFCSLCHNPEAIGAAWRHQGALPYAHTSDGKFSENARGSLLDKFSAECLSCHDGTLSKTPQVVVKEGIWLHGAGTSHPIGVEYPRSGDFVSVESLPKEVRLFAGKVGCLSCHGIYTKENNLLVMNNKKSRLCLTCHRK